MMQKNQWQQQEQELVRGIEIPVNAAVLQLSRALHGNQPWDTGKLARILGSDVSLASAVLANANLPCYGMGLEITSVRQAINTLGVRRVFRLALSSALKMQYQALSRYAMNFFWGASQDVAVIAAQVSRHFLLADSDDAYMVALFRDSAVPLMLMTADEQRELFLAPNREFFEQSLMELESRFYNVPHEILGYHMAQAWGCSDRVSLAVLKHHQTDNLLEHEQAIADLLVVSYLAEALCDTAKGRLTSSHWQGLSAQVFEYLCINENIFQELVADVPNSLCVSI